MAELRKQGVFVLEKGAIDDYYPTAVTGDNKPAKAQNFCNTVKSKEQALALCAADHCLLDGSTTNEFDAIFNAIFESK